MVERPSEQEDYYFKERELEQRKEMREKLQRQAAELAQKQKIAEETGGSVELAERIQALGFDEHTATVFDLLPVIWVAWADGSVSFDERRAILRMLDERHVKADTPAFKMVESLLEERPSEAYLNQALEVLQALFEGKDVKSYSLIDMCAEVANASGGFLGIFGSKVSKAEHDLIGKIAEALGETAINALHEKI